MAAALTPWANPLWAANAELWLRPVYPLLGGVALAVGLLLVFRLAWLMLATHGAGPTVVVSSLAPAVVGGIWFTLSQVAGWELDATIVATAFIVTLAPFAALAALFLVQRKTAAIALATARETIWQPLFWVILMLGLAAIVAFPFIPYHTFGEDVKMLKECGLELIKVLALVVAIWTASLSISDEVEGRTALTVLSKPVSRRSFILGKFFGISGGVAILFVGLGLAFLISVSFKVAFEVAEGAHGAAEIRWQDCWQQMSELIPDLVLQLLQVVVLVSISVAISTRLPMLPNLVICGAVYVIGRLAPLLVVSDAGQFEIVRFMGYLFAVVLPVLDHFESGAAIAQGVAVPWEYVAWALTYAVVYCSVAMLVALIFFEDRDLA